ETIVFSGKQNKGRHSRKGFFALGPQEPEEKTRPIIKTIATLAIVTAIAVELLIPDKTPTIRAAPFRAVLPSFSGEVMNPERSEELRKAALAFYVRDNVLGYKKATRLLIRSVGLDNGNVKSMALLASCYLNLVDASNKDEEYFSVINT